MVLHHQRGRVPVETNSGMLSLQHIEKILGTVHVVCGILAITFQTLLLRYESSITVISPGMWAGCIFVITGLLAILSSCCKSTVVLAVYVMLCGMSLCASLPMLAYSAYALATDEDAFLHPTRQQSSTMMTCNYVAACQPLNAVVIVVGLVEVCVSGAAAYYSLAYMATNSVTVFSPSQSA